MSEIAIGAGSDVLVMPDPEPLGRPDDLDGDLLGIQGPCVE